MGHFIEAATFIPIVARSEREFFIFQIVSADLQQPLLREARQQAVLAYVLKVRYRYQAVNVSDLNDGLPFFVFQLVGT